MKKIIILVLVSLLAMSCQLKVEDNTLTDYENVPLKTVIVTDRLTEERKVFRDVKMTNMMYSNKVIHIITETGEAWFIGEDFKAFIYENDVYFSEEKKGY